jgi:hypothetical protein
VEDWDCGIYFSVLMKIMSRGFVSLSLLSLYYRFIVLLIHECIQIIITIHVVLGGTRHDGN